MSCCLGWGSSLLDSSDLCGTASFSTPAGQSEVSSGGAFGTLGHGQRAWGALCTGRGGVSPGDVSGRSPTHSFLAWVRPVDHTPCQLHLCSPRLQGPRPHPQAGHLCSWPTWAHHRQGAPDSAAEQRVQHEHPVWADLAPAENPLHLGGRVAPLRLLSLREVRLELERPRKSA